jgi:adenylate cyclase
LAKQLLDQPTKHQQSLGGVTKPVTILFSDIRGYSLVSAAREPHLLVQQLNQYLTAMVQCVFRFGGTLDKFIGDAVMAVWGNVTTEGVEKDAANAMRAAQAMEQELIALNKSWSAKGWPELRIGIALHHGDVVFGNVGSPQRMDFTIIGEPVNTTWKLQECTKQIGYPFLVSAEVRALTGNEFDLVPLGRVDLPSLTRSIEVFTLAKFAALKPDAGGKIAASVLPDFHPVIPLEQRKK